jgi:hypothetical protein
LIVDSKMVRSNDPDNQQRPEQHRADGGYRSSRLATRKQDERVTH